MPRETEIEIYGKITNRDGLSQAVSKEYQEQAEYVLPGEGPKRKVRVRKSQMAGSDDVLYQETHKLYHEDGSCEEINTPITEAFFASWLDLYQSPRVAKTRYVFMAMNVTAEIDGQEVKMPDLKYEVDVLTSKDGKPSAFCKIDVEIDELLAYMKEHHPGYKVDDLTVMVTQLPLGLTDVFMPDTDEHKQAVSEFFKAFEIPNPNAPQPEPAQAAQEGAGEHAGADPESSPKEGDEGTGGPSGESESRPEGDGEAGASKQSEGEEA